MADTTKIEWADKTWSPWIGCTKVSAGCAHCYAESHAKRTGQAVWGPSGTRVKTSAPYWKKPLAWNAAAAKAGTRLRVFPSLCDPFEAWGGPILDHKGASLGWCEACGWNNGYTLCVLCGREYGQRPLVLDDLRREPTPGLKDVVLGVVEAVLLCVVAADSCGDLGLGRAHVASPPATAAGRKAS